MGRQDRKRSGGQVAAPSKEYMAQQKALAEKKSLIKDLMKSPVFVAYTGDGKVHRIGFSSNADWLLFLLDQVYGWDGLNPVYQSILQNLKKQAQQNKEEFEAADVVFEELEGEAVPSVDAEEAYAGEEEEFIEEEGVAGKVVPLTAEGRSLGSKEESPAKELTGAKKEDLVRDDVVTVVSKVEEVDDDIAQLQAKLDELKRKRSNFSSK